ncbi:aspartate aminotransferase family protein [soil metagenome]
MPLPTEQDSTRPNPPESSLDPPDWNEFRALCHRAVDAMVNHLATLREQPAWQPMPPEVISALRQPLPAAPQGDAAAYQDFLTNVLPYTNCNRHARFFGWAQGNGTPLGMLADMLASGINAHLAGFNQAPALVEHQVLAWLAELMGMPTECSGLLVSGGTVANLLGVAVARHVKAGFDVRNEGLQGASHPLLTLYCSTETHSWLNRCVEVLGLGRNAVRRLPVDCDYRMDLGHLREAIAADMRAGHRPICVVANAGTVNTGAVDDLNGVADLCQEYGVWFHVDGAFGALLQLSDKLRVMVRGIERADSLAFDLHKLMYLPFEVACVLVRDAKAHRDTFTMSATYLSESDRGVIAGGLPFAERGLELTRGFKALKVWLSLKSQGVAAFARVIEQNVDQAHYLAELVNQHPDLELLAPVSMNIVCLRYAPAGLSNSVLDALNAEVLLRLQEAGTAVPSSTIINGKFAIRVAILNHRSRREDFDLTVAAILEFGKMCIQQQAAQSNKKPVSAT